MTRTIRLREYQGVPRSILPEARWDLIQMWDERLARRAGREPVLDWQWRREVRARSLVGVLRVGDITIEVLPKVVPDGESANPDPAQANLLYMLTVAEELPVSVRGMAGLASERMPLLDALATAFAARLLEELAGGADRGYRTREENLTRVRGRIVIAEDLRRNLFLRHRVFVRYDEFDEDTDLNRIFRAAASRLLGTCVSARARHLLTAIVEDLGEVQDVEILPAHFDRLVFHRSNERFRPLVPFARAVLSGRSPAPRGGPEDAFSIVFPMEDLFEAFVAKYLQRHASALGLDGRRIAVQTEGRSRHLLRRVRDGSLHARLVPDIFIEPHADCPGIILDTKWKRLKEDGGREGLMPETGDLYQMAAYLQRFRVPVGVLVFPRTGASMDEEFLVEGTESRLRVATLDLSYPLRRESERTLAQFSNVVGLQAAAAAR